MLYLLGILQSLQSLLDCAIAIFAIFIGTCNCNLCNLIAICGFGDCRDFNCNPNILQIEICNPNILQIKICNPNILQIKICNPNILQIEICNPNILQIKICNPNILQKVAIQSQSIASNPCYSVMRLSGYMCSPRPACFQLLRHIMRYLYHHPHIPIFFH